jgi:hypothetical protein
VSSCGGFADPPNKQTHRFGNKKVRSERQGDNGATCEDWPLTFSIESQPDPTPAAIVRIQKTRAPSTHFGQVWIGNHCLHNGTIDAAISFLMPY